MDNEVLFAPLVPDYNFPKKAAILLTRKEALFLWSKITNAIAVRGSLLEYMLKNESDWPSFDKISAAKLPASLARTVRLAQQFAEFIYGAHLRYNVLYSGINDGEHAKRYAKWAKAFSFAALDLGAILANVSRKNAATERFLYGFAKAARLGNIDRVNTLIVEREKEVKPGGRAKIGKPKEYPYTTPVHNHKLAYRYNTARGIVYEILAGLDGGNE
ncbi:hypothetical protein LJC46_05935 [Desulfovibrio sp. OttesenSCG-928-G15]|nr:hypothetical protein [Desulfovibrio sp. OttesenSCG-928-G15]